MSTSQSPKVLIFGPQALSFGIGSLHKLRTQLQDTPAHQWAVDTIAALPEVFDNLPKDIPKLPSRQLLEELAHGLKTGDILPSLFPLPNILLSPLVVVAQLTQFSTFLKTAHPNLTNTDPLPSSITDNTETLGLCTGILSAYAVACSSNLAEVQNNGAVAVRLAMLAGAFVDRQEQLLDSEGPSMSFSASWTALDSIASLNKVLKSFPEAYISVFVDEKRATITTRKSTGSDLIQRLKNIGVHVTIVGLSGRFHWSEHQEVVEKLLAFCDVTPALQLPEASRIVLSSRSNTSGQYITTGKLHEIALRAILLEPSQWFETFSVTYLSQLIANDSFALCFGPERCVPPTIARKLGSRLTYIADIDPLNSKLLGKIFGHYKPTLADLPDERIAVIGMSCHVPSGNDLEEYWNVLVSGQSQHKEVPTERFTMESTWREVDPERKWYGNFIENYDTFDHKFFKKSPREMATTDPQHRIGLQLAYQAVEQSGYFGVPDFDKHIGCYIGNANVDYEHNIRGYPANAYSATGNLKSLLAGKISHYFGWTGPSLTLDTACSSSSVAIHLACRAIINGEITGALAGGVNVLTGPEWYHNLAGASFLSLTGQCKPFDAAGDGYCRGEGAGLVFLKKLSSAIADGDQVLGVIAGTSVFQNQNSTAITVPNATSLSDLFVDVLQQARLEPQDISVVEAHGTGTSVGDPAEYNAIRDAIGGSIRTSSLSLTAVKGLIGHLEVASGAASLVKILLMIQEGLIPPQASFQTINPGLNARPEDQIEIVTHLKPWEAGFRAALINNYGASGSNGSMVVTQAPELGNRDSLSKVVHSKSFPFWFSGLDERSLKAYIAKLRNFLQSHAASAKNLSLANLSFQVYRQSNRSLPWALVFNANSSQDLEQKLAAFEKGESSVPAIQKPSTRPVILCFGGQISTFVGLDKTLYDNVTILRSHLDQCNAICLSLGLDSIYPDIFQRSNLNDIVKLQTVLFATQYSCAKTWIDCGINAVAIVGHSFGELTGLCVSGVLSLKDALTFISGRARLIQNRWGNEKGSMLAVEAELPDVQKLLVRAQESSGSDTAVTIACYNGLRSFTLAGSVADVDVTEGLARNDPTFSMMKVKRLNVTNAFHCTLVDPLKDELELLGHRISFREPNIRIERATELSGTNQFDAGYGARHLRSPVFFHHAVQRLAKEYPSAIWLEAGSNSTVTAMASRALGSPNLSHFQPVNVTADDSLQFLVDATTRLWREGLNVTFWAHHAKQISYYTPLILPPYQFEKSRHWMELKKPLSLESPAIKAPPQQIDVPKGLTTFAGYQDDNELSVRFRVNTSTEKFQRMISAHIMAHTAAAMPGMFQVEIALDALTSLRSEFHDFSYQPELQGLAYFSPLVAGPDRIVWFDAETIDDDGLVWEWQLLATEANGSLTRYTSGTMVFRPINDPQAKSDFARLARLSGQKRCIPLLDGNEATDVLQGRNIYRAFEPVIDYKEIYRHLTKLVGRNLESAGRVIKSYKAEGWLDSILTDCFCQVAGIFVNLMTDTADLSERGIYVGDRVDRWIRAPGLRTDPSNPQVWEVYAESHLESDTSYVSDVFAFDARDGSLVEAVLGIRYCKVPMGGIRKVLSRYAPAGQQPSAVAPAPAPAQYPPPFRATSSLSTTLAKAAGKVNGTKKAPEKAAQQSGPDIPAKSREILCNLSGIEPDEIQDDVDLVEIGIDSLMAMELIREVDIAFKCKLTTEQLMSLTDFKSLVVCIQTTLGISEPEANGAAEDISSDEEGDVTPATNVSTSYVNGVSGVNGHASPSAHSTVLPPSLVLDVFAETKSSTDRFIIEGHMGNYYKVVRPRSTQLCTAYFVEALEQLGCPIQSAKQGQKLQRVTYLPKHEKFMKVLYDILETEARLIDINDSELTRTAVACPAKPAAQLLTELLRDEPIHAPEFKLAALTGSKLADCLTGKQDGLQIIFGSVEGRQTVSDVYAIAPINNVWVKQATAFIEKLLNQLPKDGQTVNILEMGAGTGGTTSAVVPMLARLGVPIKYTMSDLSPSLIGAARRRFKQYTFMDFKVVNIESPPDEEFQQSQHIILANACVHATRSLPISLSNIHSMLRPDGILLLLEETEQLPWVDFVFGLLEGWWLFEDGRNHAQASAAHWGKILSEVGFGHVDWTDGNCREAQVQRIIIGYASDTRYDRVPMSIPSSYSRGAKLTDTTDRQAVIEKFIHKYTEDFAPAPASGSPHTGPITKEKCVLVTGATGSLGAHIVAALAKLPDVYTVICLNRLGTIDATARQHDAFRLRGITLESSVISKLKMLEADTSKPMLGLPLQTYQSLVQSTTHVVHNAWPMSLTRSTEAYEPQFKVMANLIQLANLATAARPSSFQFGFQLISSIGVVGYYPLLTDRSLAPEEPGTAETALPVGYADAKLVCERMLEKTLRQFPERFYAMAVRIAQITGSRTNGYWNPLEHFSFFVKSSKALKILPDLRGTLSWCPVNDVADTLRDLLTSDKEPYAIYHIENPSRQPWQEMIETLAHCLDIPHENIVPYEKWMERVEQFAGSTNDNPARQLMDFWENHFLRMSCGGLILDTKKSREHSKHLRGLGPVSSDLVVKYISAWMSSGFLPPQAALRRF